MARRQFQTVSYNDFGLGINRSSTADALMDGECRDIVNGDLTAGNDVAKRIGWQLEAGVIPFRVSSISTISSASKTTIRMYLDTSTTNYDILGVGQTGICVWGKVSNTQVADFTTSNTYQFYASDSAIFSIDGTGQPYIDVLAKTGNTYNATDDSVEMYVWGLNATARNATTVNKVNGLFRYSREAEEELVLALNGDFFSRLESSTLPSGYTSYASTTTSSPSVTSDILSLTSETGIVVGDILSVGGFDRKFRVTELIRPICDFNTLTTTSNESVPPFLSSDSYRIFQRLPYGISGSDITQAQFRLSKSSATSQPNGSLVCSLYENTVEDYSTASKVAESSPITYDSLTQAAGSPGTTETFTFTSAVDVNSSKYYYLVLDISGLSWATGYVQIDYMYSATQLLLDVDSEKWAYIYDVTTTTLDSSLSSPLACTLLNPDGSSGVRIDESISVSAGVSVSIDSRWIPITSPTSSDDLVPVTYSQYMAQDPDARVRGAMVNDSLFLVNGTDPVMKYDGDNISRAGIIPWQPALFANYTSQVTSIVPPEADSGPAYTAIGVNTFTLDIDGAASLNVGDSVQDTASGGSTHEIIGIRTKNDGDFVQVKPNITSSAGTGTLTPAPFVYYYFRMNAIDANNNLVASAATNYEDYRIRIPFTGQIQLKLVGMPTWDYLDYDRIELQIYRTQLGRQAPFHLVQTRQVDFNNADGYIIFNDSDDGTNWTTSDYDPIMTSLVGSELGTGWEQPPIAKYVASTQNRLLLANLTDVPKLNMILRPKDGETFLSSKIATSPGSNTLLFRKDKTDIATDCDMLNRVGFEFVKNSPTLPSYESESRFIDTSADGLWLISGAYLDDTKATNAGRASVFRYSNTGWVSSEELFASDAALNDNFGQSVAINDDGTYCIVGASGNRAAYIFNRSGSEWIQQQKITGGSSFGFSVAINGDGTVVAIGAYDITVGGFAGAGSVYIYTRSGAAWTLSTTLTAAGDAELNAYFSKVSLNSAGDVCAVGAYREDLAGTDQGAVYIFKNSGGWALDQKLTAGATVDNGAWFGHTVVLSSSGTRLVVAAEKEGGGGTEQGAVYVFLDAGGSWSQEQRIDAAGYAENIAHFGYSIDIDDTNATLCVGAYLEDAGGTNTGAIYVYERVGTTWNVSQRLTGGSYTHDSLFLGYSCSILKNGAGILAGSDYSWGGYIPSGGALFFYSGSLGSYAFDILIPQTLGDNRAVISSGGVNQWSFITDTSFTITTQTSTPSDIPPPSAGHWVYLYSRDSSDDLYTSPPINEVYENDLTFAGWWQVASSTSNSFTVNFDKTNAPFVTTVLNTDITTADPAVFSVGTDVVKFFPNNTRVVLQPDTGTLPTGLTGDVVWYVSDSDLSAGTFTLTSERNGGGSAAAKTGAGTCTAVQAIKYHLPTHWCTASTAGYIPVPIYQDYNFASLLNGTILNSNSSTDSQLYLQYQMSWRLSQAINACMRMVDTSISGYETFKPWMSARGGNDFQHGELEIRFPDATTTPEVELPSSFSSLYRWFVNTISQSNGAEVEAITTMMPSRLVRSYPNFPEIFDAPFAISADDSDSAIDVNAADGEEITGIVNYFGDSAFGGAQRGALVVVFKTDSVYIVDVEAKGVQKLDSKGQGCTAPDSIAVAANGVFFANSSGVWLLNKQLQVEFIGRRLEGLWKSSVNRDALSACVGTVDPINRRYMLSVPTGSSTTADQVYVYNFSRQEEEGAPGGWTRYELASHMDQTAWAYWDGTMYFGNPRGEVFAQRQAGDDTDYRDDTSAITFQVDHKPLDFGLPGQRKVLSSIITRWVAGSDMTSTSLGVAIDNELSFAQSTVLEFVSGTANIEQLRSSTPYTKRKGKFFQIQLVNSVKDEPCQLSGIDFVVGVLNPGKGLKDIEESN